MCNCETIARTPLVNNASELFIFLVAMLIFIGGLSFILMFSWRFVVKDDY